MKHPSPHPILAITLAVTILDLILPADSAIFDHIPTRYPQGFLAFLNLLSAGCILQSPICHLPPASCILPSPRAKYSHTHILSYSHPSHVYLPAEARRAQAGRLTSYVSRLTFFCPYFHLHPFVRVFRTLIFRQCFSSFGGKCGRQLHFRIRKPALRLRYGAIAGDIQHIKAMIR